MNSAVPHFLLFVEASLQEIEDRSVGFWHFAVEALDSTDRFEAKDYELETSLERLELLALVRGMESLEQPSKLTLVSASSHLSRGLRKGLPVWRESNWQWERFGEMAPVRDRDLWKRVDNALSFHQMQSRVFRVDAGHQVAPSSSRRRRRRPTRPLNTTITPTAGIEQATPSRSDSYQAEHVDSYALEPVAV